MRKPWLVLVPFLLAVPARAGETETGFVSLFNGKDFTGWRYYKEDLKGKTETADKRFTVENGVIVAQEGKGIKDLFTVQEFAKDFHLKVEFRASPKSDSGVYIRAPGSQLQVRDYIRRNERGQLKGKFKDDDWNLLDIHVKANVIVSKVNGKDLTSEDVLEVVVKGGKPSARLNGKEVEVKNVSVTNSTIAKCYCNGVFLEDMVVPAKGGIGLQAETGKFEFRNIRIKEMP